jgi:hypothetical protein
MASAMRDRGWIGTALLAGAIYAGLGIVASAMGGTSAPESVRTLARWGAFLLSGVTLAAHVANESLVHRRGAVRSAWHVAVGAALGGFGLAASANLHELVSQEGFRMRMLLALPGWPLLTGAAAFVAGLMLSAVLRLVARDPRAPHDAS